MKFAILKLYNDDTLELQEIVDEESLDRGELLRGLDYRLWELELNKANKLILKRCIRER